MRLPRVLILAFCPAMLAACGATEHHVIQPVRAPGSFPAAEIRPLPAAASLPADVSIRFEDRICSRIAAARTTTDPELLIEYRFVTARHEDGRSVVVDVAFRNRDDEVLARFQAEAGPSFENAMNRVADEIARFGLEHFGLEVTEAYSAGGSFASSSARKFSTTTTRK